MNKMKGDGKRTINGETFIRQLPYSSVRYLSLMLDIERNWEKLVVKIPKRLQDVGKCQCEKRYSTLQVKLFEEKSKRPDGSPTKSILDDWSTQNAKVKHLIFVLQQAALYEAADYISEQLLGAGKVPRLGFIDSSNTDVLPTPTWDDNKLKTGNKPKDSKQTDSLLDENRDNSVGKTLYSRDKGLDSLDKNEPGTLYSSLMKNDDSGPEYNKLIQNDDKGFNCYRTPSFDSWGACSIQNEAGHDTSKQSGIEHEETYQVRPVRDEASLKQSNNGVYTYAKGVYQFATEVPEPDHGPSVQETPSQPRREPCQNEDVSGASSENEELYKILGKQSLTYELLQRITDDFNPKVTMDGGRIIGMGGFGDVFLGLFENGFKCAVKKLKNVDEGIEKQFETELHSLVKYRHKNIVRLFGFSIDGPGKCLVYEYLCNGSLEDRLTRQGQTQPLPNNVRISILQGTAQGINFLNSQGIVHRDIKSANVLLDENFVPKVGDFATARTGPRGNATMAMSTQVVIGTSAYLAPEAYNFDVSTKLDSYSFGIIILEVLTSLPPLDHSREEKDIKSYVEENEITPLLDASGGKWLDKTVATLVDISDKCTAIKKKQRANVQDILVDLMAVE
ncbi:Interleukin-1 receptor-associated kinase 4 [Mactra antiquata]